MAVFTSQSNYKRYPSSLFCFSQVDRYVFFSDYTFMKHYNILFNFFFRLADKAPLMPRAFLGTSMYYTLHHVVFTSAFDNFLSSRFYYMHVHYIYFHILDFFSYIFLKTFLLKWLIISKKP